MSEDTHYQVALTNGQVLTAFAVLLGCLIGVFFAGVWLGRGSVDTAPAFAATAGDLPEVAEEFAFFSGDDALSETSPPAEPVPAASPRQAEKRAAATQPPEPEPVVARRPEPEPAPAEAPPPPPEAMEPAAARRPASGPAEAPVERGEGYMIQVFASADRGKAEELVERLVDADFSAYLAPSDDPDREVYRVRVGPLPNRETAETQASELERRWGLESWISASAP